MSGLEWYRGLLSALCGINMAPAEPGVLGKRQLTAEPVKLRLCSEASGQGRAFPCGWSAGQMSQCSLQGLLQEGGVGL